MSKMRNIAYGRMLPDGSVKVWATVGQGYREVVGRLMPGRRDSRQQPKSLAMRLIEKRTHVAKVRRLLVGHQHTPMMATNRARLTFIDTMDGTAVKDADGRELGLILPTVPRSALGYGIQSWSIPR